MASAIQFKALAAVACKSGRRMDELHKFVLGHIAYEDCDYHVMQNIVVMLLDHKCNSAADVQNSVLYWMHPEFDDMYLDHLLSFCEWIVAMSKMPSLKKHLEDHDWRELSFFTPLDRSHHRFNWGCAPSTDYLVHSLKRAANRAKITSTSAPRSAPAPVIEGPAVQHLLSSGGIAATGLTLGISEGADTPSVGAKRRRHQSPIAPVPRKKARSPAARGGTDTTASSDASAHPSAAGLGDIARALPSDEDSSLNAQALCVTTQTSHRRVRDRPVVAESSLRRGVPNVASSSSAAGGHSCRHAFLSFGRERGMVESEVSLLNGWNGKTGATRYNRPSAEVRRSYGARLSGHINRVTYLPFPWHSYPDGPNFHMPFALKEYDKTSFDYLVQFARKIVSAAHKWFDSNPDMDLATYVTEVLNVYSTLREPQRLQNPAARTPALVPVASAPVAVAPAPVAVAPAPVAVAPAIAADTPARVAVAPATAADSPAPAAGPLAPADGPLAPVAGTPAPSARTPVAVAVTPPTRRSWSAIPKRQTSFAYIYQQWHHGTEEQNVPLKSYSTLSELKNPWIKSADLDTQVSHRRCVVAEMDRRLLASNGSTVEEIANAMVTEFGSFSKALKTLQQQRIAQRTGKPKMGRPPKARPSQQHDLQTIMAATPAVAASVEPEGRTEERDT